MLPSAMRAAARSVPRAPSSVPRRGMAYKVPMRDIQFLLHEVNDSRAHYAALPKSGGLNATPETVQMIIEESAKFAENELAPINVGGDRVGCKQTGPNAVVTPPGFKAAYEQFVAGGWQGLTFPEKWGGQGMPNSIALIQSDMTATANWTWTMCVRWSGSARVACSNFPRRACDRVFLATAATATAGTPGSPKAPSTRCSRTAARRCRPSTCRGWCRASGRARCA